MTEREASREKFEEFWISRYKDEKVGRRALNDDDYGYVSRDWLFWQASRQQALSEAVTRAVIHSQYPIDCDFDRGYAKARKDAAEDIRSLTSPRNQCDGCARRLPINSLGIHKNGDEAVMMCTADRYSPIGDKA